MAIKPGAYNKSPMVSREGSWGKRVDRKSYDPTNCPAGYDADVWDLALRFRQYAEADQVELSAPLPVIYGLLKNRIEASGVKNHKLIGSDGTEKSWQQFMRAMLKYYADKEHFSEHEADLFCNPLTFQEYCRAMINISWSNRVKAGLIQGHRVGIDLANSPRGRRNLAKAEAKDAGNRA